MLSPDACDPGGTSRPGVPPPELGDRASSFPNPYADKEELGGLCNEKRGKGAWVSHHSHLTLRAKPG